MPYEHYNVIFVTLITDKRMISPELLANMLPERVKERMYEDAVSPLAKEVGKIGGDAGKAARLLLFPLQLAGALQDRLQPVLDRIGKRVPEERRVPASPAIVGPVLHGMQYEPDTGELWKMYEEILTKSVDSGAYEKIHPSFSHIISQLSRDEAWLIYRIHKTTFNVTDSMDLAGNRFYDRKIECSEIPLHELCLPEQIDLYYSHLDSLSLLKWPVLDQTPIYAAGKQTGIRRHSKIELTEFGRLFADVCIPPHGFDQFASKEA